MDIARPYSAVSPSLEGDVLVVLAGTTAALTGRDVARLARRGTQPAVAAALDRLVSQGLVHREEAGSAFLHTLNRDHVAAQAVGLLAGLRVELFQRLRHLLSSWSIPPVHASVFGSTARGDGDKESDVDLLVIRPSATRSNDATWDAQVAELRERVLAWSGNHASIVQLSASEIPKLARTRPPVLESVRSEGIHLAGVPVRELIGERA